MSASCRSRKTSQTQPLSCGACSALFSLNWARRTGTKYARRTFKEADGRLVPDYDVKLGTILTEVDLDKPLPAMWKEFDALAHLPVMVIRGGNSDILSAATVAAMQARHPALQVVEVPDQGHAPLLAEADVIGQHRDIRRVPAIHRKKVSRAPRNSARRTKGARSRAPAGLQPCIFASVGGARPSTRLSQRRSIRRRPGSKGVGRLEIFQGTTPYKVGVTPLFIVTDASNEVPLNGSAKV